MDAAIHQPSPLPPAIVSQGQALPSIASLTGTLVPADQSPMRMQQHGDPREVRDSGNWSISQQSKHSSTVSQGMGLQLQTLLNPSDDSPARQPVPDTPSSARYPSGNPQTSQPNVPPLLNQAFDHRQSFDHNSHLDSRRSSVDSRVNVGMNHLAISPSSPFDSQNASRLSLVSNLQQQRGIPDTRTNGPSPSSPLEPNATRTNLPPRRAPVINPNPRSVSGMPDPNAPMPTKGFAWAFPSEVVEEERRGSSSGSSVERLTMTSRQNSLTASVASTMFADGKLPLGQQRMDDETLSTHHHSMQHRSVTSLQSISHADALAASSGNYSRTPELRVSHKMAERKRRSEMKNLFDELNNILPNSPGSKSSKWEVLTKSIEYIKNLNRLHEATRQEVARLRPDAEYYRRAQEENEMLRQELTSTWQQLRRADPNTPHIYGTFTGMLVQQQSATPAPAHNVLPPLQQHQPQQQAAPQPQSAQWANQNANAMQGVEFGGIRPYEHPHR